MTTNIGEGARRQLVEEPGGWGIPDGYRIRVKTDRKNLSEEVEVQVGGRYCRI